MAVEGISESMARLVYNHFHEKLIGSARVLAGPSIGLLTPHIRVLI